MSYGRINPISDPSYLMSKLTSANPQRTIQDCFEAKGTASAILVDLTAAYGTVWHRGLIVKFLQLLPDRHNYDALHCLVLKTSYGQQSGLRRLKTGFPQGFVLAALLFNIYIHTSLIPSPINYGYADDLTILTAHREWKRIDSTLSQDMRQWILKLSEDKTVSTVFHLNIKEAKRELNV